MHISSWNCHDTDVNGDNLFETTDNAGMFKPRNGIQNEEYRPTVVEYRFIIWHIEVSRYKGRYKIR